jgi:HTH-type transcriptional regulator, sugar sensing transcriptional regulator
MLEEAQKTLQDMGLSESEIKVYVAALELGQASIQEIAKKASIPRTSIYNFLSNLMERRLIWETSRKKRKVYSAAHPSHLVEMEKGRVAQVKSIVPELLAVYNKNKHKPRVTFYEGLDGIKQVYADTLVEEEPIIEWTDYQALKNALGTYYKEYPVERAKREIVVKSIVSDDKEAHQAVASDAKLLRETKFISAKELATDVMVYGEKVALLSLKSTPPFAVLIEDPNLAKTLRVVWQELWDKL